MENPKPYTRVIADELVDAIGTSLVSSVIDNTAIHGDDPALHIIIAAGLHNGLRRLKVEHPEAVKTLTDMLVKGGARAS